MKKTELINSEISAVISRMGHTDGITIADCGLPIPDNVKRIDLALVRNEPSFIETLKAVVTELCVERAVIATELFENNKELLEKIQTLLPGVTIENLPHKNFKELTSDTKAIIRTGECTSFANIILYSGVTF